MIFIVCPLNRCKLILILSQDIDIDCKHCKPSSLRGPWNFLRYAYQMLKHNGCTLPGSALELIRLQSFFSWFDQGAYCHFQAPCDAETLKWVKEPWYILYKSDFLQATYCSCIMFPFKSSFFLQQCTYCGIVSQMFCIVLYNDFVQCPAIGNMTAEFVPAVARIRACVCMYIYIYMQ